MGTFARRLATILGFSLIALLAVWVLAFGPGERPGQRGVRIYTLNGGMWL